MIRAIIVFMVTVALYCVVVYGYLATRPSWYFAEFDVVVDPLVEQKEPLAEIGMRQIRSIDVINLALQNDPVVNYESLARDRNKLYYVLESTKSRIKTEKLNSHIFHVTCFDPEYIKAADFAALMSESFLEYVRNKRLATKVKYRNRLYRRLRIIKKFIEKAENEIRLIEELDKRKEKLDESEGKLREVEEKIESREKILESISTYFKTQKTELKEIEKKLASEFLPEWPPLVEIRKRIEFLEKIMAAESENDLRELRESYEETEWLDKKREKFSTIKNISEIKKEELPDIQTIVQADKEAFAKVKKVIDEKFSPFPPGDAPEDVEEDEENEPVEEKRGEENFAESVREKQAELLWIVQMKELDNSTNPPNFTLGNLREKLASLKNMAEKLKDDLSEIEAVIEAEPQHYSISNLTPYARKAKLIERQPMLTLILVGLGVALFFALLAALTGGRGKRKNSLAG
ncbi:MAG: GumC domain-containing protein [Planctomycetota bacterium]|jgi:DNA repair exonuclease SbcCD ATPase subunit